MGELSKTLTPENRDEVLPRFFHLSKREAKAVAAAIRPDQAPPRREVITALRMPEAPRREPAVAATAPSAPGEPSLSLGVVRPDELDRTAAPASPTPPPAVAQPVPPPSTIEPLSAELIRVHLTADKRFADKLEKAKDALSHSLPAAGMADVLEAGLDLVIERQAKRRGLVEKPRASPPPSSNQEYVPAHVKRAVWKRDEGKCQFPLASGGICGSTRRVEIDHITPRAAGGPSTVENCRLACDVHNDVAARRFFGDAWMDRYTGAKRSARPRRMGRR